MGDFYSHKNLKQDNDFLFGENTKSSPHLDVKIHKKKEGARLQRERKIHPFLNKSLPFYLKIGPTQKAPHLEGKGKKRSRLDLYKSSIRTQPVKDLQKTEESKGSDICITSPTSGKRRVALTLSESFVNLIMVDGQKSQAEKIFSQTLKKLAEHLQNDVEEKRDKKKKVNLFDRGENKSLLIISDRAERRNVYHLLQKAIDNVKPTLQVRKVRIARSMYQVPFIMKRRRQEKSAVRWIIESARKKSRHSGASFSERLASSVLEAFMAQGQAREKRDQLHRTAEANRAYLRYRWW